MTGRGILVRKGTDAMRRASRWLTVLVSSLSLAAGAFAQAPARVAPGQPVETMSPADQEMQSLLEQLSRVSDNLVRNIQSPQAWRYQAEQGDLLLQLASRSKKVEERNNWLKMAVDSYYSAAVQSGDNEPAAQQRLAQLPALLAQHFPGNTLFSYAAMRGVHADYTRALAKGGDPAQAQDVLRQRLLRFAQEYPRVPEAPQAIMDAAGLGESLGKTDDACRSYRYLAEHYPAQPLCRKARGALRRLGGLDGETVELKLPLLYPGSTGDDKTFDLKQMRGSVVLLYFWASTSPQAAEGFEALKRLTDRYQYHGLEVVYVNLDGDASKAKEYLAGRLIAGTHVVQPGGLNGAIAQRYGIEELPQMFLVGKDGGLVRHSLPPAQFEAALSGLLPRVERHR
jgi:hypothetical protein